MHSSKMTDKHHTCLNFSIAVRDSMNKAIYKRNHSSGGFLVVSEGESLTIMPASVAAGRPAIMVLGQ